MDVIDVISGCLEALVKWRLSLLTIIGALLALCAILWVQPKALSIGLAAASFAGGFIFGLYWQRAAERRGH